MEPTNFTRKSGTAGVAITDVKLVDVVSNRIGNWALRLVAIGRDVACDMFRNRPASTFSSMLFS